MELSFYRTRSQLEVDLLITTPHGVWGLEAKAGGQLGGSDHRGLREVAEALGARWRGGLMVYRGKTLDRLEEKLWAVPIERLLV